MLHVDIRELPEGDARWWCVHPARFDARSFNPNTDGDPLARSVGGRFHPFDDVERRRVATRYLADHPNGALAETLLRDGSVDRLVSVETIERHRLSQLGLRRALRLADLTRLHSASPLGAAMRRDTDAYPQLRDVAATLHAEPARLDGILWEGRQLETPGMLCLLLFGDRVSGTDDLTLIQSLELHRGPGLAPLQAAARLRRYTLPAALSTRRQ